MNLTIVYDNEIFEDKDGTADHGFSCYIETGENTILFDTGTNGKILIDNMKKLSLHPEEIDIILISHEHYDHNGGLPTLLPYLNNATIYRLEPSNTQSANKEIIVHEPFQITKQIRSTGRLNGSPVDEQSLLLQTKNGLFVLTGCSHPGVSHILLTAKTYGNVVGLIGGFHGFSDFDSLKSLKQIYPCHCTKYKQEIKDYYPNKTRDCGVGCSLSI